MTTRKRRRQSLQYRSRHQRVRNRRGSPSRQSCAHCGAPARDWATIHGRDGMDPLEDYMPLCRPCHLAYDDRSEDTRRGIAAFGEDRTLRRAPPESRARMSAAQKASWQGREATPAQRAALATVNRSRRGQPLSSQHREKISAATRGRAQSPDHLAARLAAMAEYWENRPPATVEAARRRWSKRNGPARDRVCAECGKQACDWASADDGFMPLCRPCNMSRRSAA